ITIYWPAYQAFSSPKHTNVRDSMIVFQIADTGDKIWSSSTGWFTISYYTSLCGLHIYNCHDIFTTVKIM
ncbi:MAG: hypothetical protein WBZ36_19040, partial [Candidatus Nitrosopolaris sp.]